jgi:hypothetical protein
MVLRTFSTLARRGCLPSLGPIQFRLSSRTLQVFEAVRHMERFPVVVSACSNAEHRSHGHWER